MKMPKTKNHKTAKEIIKELFDIDPKLPDDDILIKILNISPKTLKQYKYELRINKNKGKTTLKK